MFRARRCSVESLVGRMIQRTTRDTTRGETSVALSVERNVKTEFGVVWSASKCSVQRGILIHMYVFVKNSFKYYMCTNEVAGIQIQEVGEDTTFGG